jgi:predicted nuclease of restriction endonuclease-like (RecB) superfamily
MNDELKNSGRNIHSQFTTNNSPLFEAIQQIVEQGKQQVAQAVNAGLTATYWNIGKQINEDILKHKRAEYGKQVLQSLSAQLTNEYGKGWSVKQLQHCLRFVEIFPDIQIVSSLLRQLSWTHFLSLIYLKTDLEREFYAQMCRVENWSTRTLRKKIDSMLFERTAISKKPEELAKLELNALKEEDKLSADLVFRDHYILDFLNLKDTYAENDLEAAILKEIENFLIELGSGFTFVARQKRMIIDNTDFYLDLLFYHRKLKRLVAIELKIGKFKASYKGQMELYLRYLEKYETEPDEETPIGLILCAEGNQEQVELLQLDKANIKVAEYITEYLPKELLAKKLHQFTLTAKRLIENRDQS